MAKCRLSEAAHDNKYEAYVFEVNGTPAHSNALQDRRKLIAENNGKEEVSWALKSTVDSRNTLYNFGIEMKIAVRGRSSNARFLLGGIFARARPFGESPPCAIISGGVVRCAMALAKIIKPDNKPVTPLEEEIAQVWPIRSVMEFSRPLQTFRLMMSGRTP